MKVQTIAWGILSILIFAGLASISSRTNSDDSMIANDDVNAPGNQFRAFSGTLSDVRMQGTAQCTFTHTNESGDSKGTVYVANGLLRGDFVSTVSHMTIESHVIVDGEFAYSWSPISPSGVKALLSEHTGATSGVAGIEYASDSMDYRCTSWEIDTSVFSLPSGISFVEIDSEGNQPAIIPAGTVKRPGL